MITDILIGGNKQVTLVISPENEMENEALKLLMKQNNEIIEIRNPVTIFGKTIPAGIAINQKSPTKESKPNES